MTLFLCEMILLINGESPSIKLCIIMNCVQWTFLDWQTLQWLFDYDQRHDLILGIEYLRLWGLFAHCGALPISRSLGFISLTLTF